ncbi:hypothetical protein [Lysobacter brunescens]|uniref:Uncharacterized protein n=1 Tax=Lysobacter brunescens TaxID=262323 RepID=A0ABW2YD25_9GAMM
MTTFLSALLTLLYVLMALFAALYATWLFVSRIRRGKSKPRSFLRWLRDLWDAVSGIG